MGSTSLLTANPSSSLMEDFRELDAARTLLGVSPVPAPASPSPNDSSSVTTAPVLVDTEASSEVPSKHGFRVAPKPSTSAPPVSSGAMRPQSGSSLAQVPEESPLQSPARGLDALAALASTEQAKMGSTAPLAPFLVQGSSPGSSSDEDCEVMPPPPPRARRRRSVSNPEGMEKWDSVGKPSNRRHFVLPASILEEELAEASAAIREQEAERKNSVSEEETAEAPKPAEDEDEANLTPDELLRRARSRLLEDLSEGNISGEKGVLTLPHSLSKYKQVYNKNGRIGIYTPSERAAIIARYNGKRLRRVWNKKIRYNCRKSLADRRLRVKGRFVKRSEQEQLKKQLAAEAEKAAAEEAVPKAKPEQDEDMPDVNDPEAGFSPTEDQPYRRLRRHTIT